MSEQLENAMSLCILYLSRFERSSHRIERFHLLCKELKSFIALQEQPYSEQILWSFDDEYSKPLNTCEKFDVRRNLTILHYVLQQGLPAEGFHIPIWQKFWELPFWCRKSIRNFQEFSCLAVSQATLANYEKSLTHFLAHLDLHIVTNIHDLTHRVVIGYRDSDKTSELGKRQRNSDVKSYLFYLERQHLVKPTLHLVLEPCYQDEAIVLEVQRKEFNDWKTIVESEPTIPIDAYNQGISALKHYLTTNNYSQNWKNSLIHGATEFQLFLYTNSLGYSIGIAKKWLNFRHSAWTRMEYYSNYRAIHLINELLTGKQVSSTFPHKDYRKYKIPEILKHHLIEYIIERQQEELSPSTISMINCSCNRFLQYVESIGIKDLSLLTPQIIKDFNLQDSHSTVGGKQAYNSRIRQFLIFMARKKIVPLSLHLALPTITAHKVGIVTVLDIEQKEAIKSHFSINNTVKDMRDNAVIAMGLDLGIRGIDIVNLQFSNIDWKKEEMSFQQQKTGVWICLPFPISVGNAIYTYITKARPESDSPYIFLSFKAPFNNMTSGICPNSINRVLAQANLAPTNGFHITRKTFASKLLNSGTPYSTISNLLGHTDNTTLKVYIATDEQGLRQCALPLHGIEYKGDLL